MRGICIGMGSDEWKQAAAWAAARMERMTGVQCTVIDTPPSTHAVHPSWYKCDVALRNHPLTAKIPADETIFIFDADLIPLRPWRPDQVFDDRFAAVAEPPSHWIDTECRNWGVSLPYFNTGFLASNGTHDYLWRKTWEFHPNGGTWAEQTAMNLVAQRTNTSINFLPESFNTLRRPFHEDLSPDALWNTGVINIHFAGLQGRIDILRSVQEAIDDARF